jgi:AcrR family transcriptional regulator
LSSREDETFVTVERGGGDGSVVTARDRPQRADAQRNRAKVLAAAAELFAAEGLEVPIDTIADRAGVGVGTVYRHFPTKEALYEAIVVDRINVMVTSARTRLAERPPETAFFEFLDYLVAQFLKSSDLLRAIADAGLEFAVLGAEAKKDLESSVSDLLVAAQRAGAVRSDVTAPVVLALIGASCVASKNPHPGATTADMLRIVLDGLRA